MNFLLRNITQLVRKIQRLPLTCLSKASISSFAFLEKYPAGSILRYSSQCRLAAFKITQVFIYEGQSIMGICEVRVNINRLSLVFVCLVCYIQIKINIPKVAVGSRVCRIYLLRTFEFLYGGIEFFSEICFQSGLKVFFSFLYSVCFLVSLSRLCSFVLHAKFHVCAYKQRVYGEEIAVYG